MATDKTNNLDGLEKKLEMSNKEEIKQLILSEIKGIDLTVSTDIQILKKLAKLAQQYGLYNLSAETNEKVSAYYEELGNTGEAISLLINAKNDYMKVRQINDVYRLRDKILNLRGNIDSYFDNQPSGR